MSSRELKLDSRRLLLSAGLAIAVHAGGFFLIPAVLRLQSTKSPEYGGTVLVQLEELPPAAPVVTELPPPPPQPPVPVEPEVVPEPAPLPEPAPQLAAEAIPAPKPAAKPAPRPAPKPATTAPRTTSTKPAAAVPAAPVTPLVKETPAPVPTGPAFKEAGQRTGVSAPLPTQPALGTAKTPQAVPGPEPTQPAVGSPRGTQPAGTQSTQKSGVGVPVPVPTAKPAGSSTKGTAAGSVSGTAAGPALDFGPLDKALSSSSSKTATAPARSPAGTSAGSGDFSLAWEDPDAGKDRTLLSAPRATVPESAKKEGLRLTTVVTITVTPGGLVARTVITRGSGSAEVDAAVLDALRRWRFSAADTTKNASAAVTYTLIPR